QPSTRDVDVTFNESDSTDAVDLAGWTVVLTPDGQSPHQPENSTQIYSVSATSDHVVHLSRVPSGIWKVTLRHLGTDQEQDDFDIPVTEKLVVSDTDATPTTFTLDRTSVDFSL